MLFPQQAVRACDELYARNTQLAHSDNDNDRRKLTRMIVEQIAFELGAGWGCKKRAGVSDDFQSKDAIAFREDDGTVSVWDWQNGTTRKRCVNEGESPTYPHLSPQEAAFMPVDAVNHLHEATHKYEGGENDNGTCDKCGKSRFDSVHVIPLSTLTHRYDGGEGDTGLCDVCQKARNDSIHDVQVPAPVQDLAQTNDLLRQVLDVMTRQNDILDQLRRVVAERSNV
jgi:hypothetical protein